MEFQQLYFDIPDSNNPAVTHRLACTQWGNPLAKNTILCVHGLTRNGRDFDFLARVLGEDFRVLCPDIPGRGKSDSLQNPLDYNNPAYTAAVIFMLYKLAITRVHWIGTSMGGIMGMIAANTNPGLLASLTLNDVGCLIPAAGMARIKSIAGVKAVFDSRAEAETVFKERTASFGITDEAQWRHLFAYGIKEDEDGRVRFTYDPAIFNNPAFAKDAPVTDMDLWPMWEAVKKMPVLLIRGTKSDILTRETALEMQARHPNLTLKEIEGVGHAPALMNDGQIGMIQEWLNNVVAK